MEGVGEDWEEGTLGDLVEFNYGKGLKRSDRSDGKFPVYGSSGIVDYHSEPLVESDGVIIGRKGTLGVVNYSSNPFWPIDTTYYVTPKTVSNGIRYIYLLMKSFDFSKLNSDSAVPGLNRNTATALIVKIPPPGIINKFDKEVKPYFDKMTLNNNSIETTAELRNAIIANVLKKN